MKKTTRLEDLAKISGMSIATISRALNDHPNVNEATKRKIWQLAREHDYAFRPHMPSILSGAAATIGLIIPPARGVEAAASDPFFIGLASAIFYAAQQSNCDILVSHKSPRTREELESQMSGSRWSGAIILGQSSLHEHLNSLAASGYRFVVWGAQLPGQRYCSVGSDNFPGGQRATEHLLRLGRKRIVFLGDTERPQIMQRFQGYSAALEAAGLPVDMALTSTVYFEKEAAQMAIERLIANRVDFDAVFAASDLAAIGAIRALQRAGRKVPEDVSVVGYDNIELGQLISPALTTVSQNTHSAGRLIVSKLLGAVEAGDLMSERIATDLIVRQSCGA